MNDLSIDLTEPVSQAAADQIREAVNIAYRAGYNAGVGAVNDFYNREGLPAIANMFGEELAKAKAEALTEAGTGSIEAAAQLIASAILATAPPREKKVLRDDRGNITGIESVE